MSGRTETPGVNAVHALRLAGFQVSITGRFWVSTEGPVAYQTETVKGINYALFAALNGRYQATYAPQQ